MDWMRPILGQEQVAAAPVVSAWTESLLRNVAAAVVFGLVGVVLFAIAFFAIRRMVPFSIEKELAEDQNTALGIVLGAMMLGIAIIVAAAIH